MGLWMLCRRRWRIVLGMSLVTVLVLNAVAIMDVTNFKTGGVSTYRTAVLGGSSHLQVIRKRLNKSYSNSSSLNYVDWDHRDGAFDPEQTKVATSRRFEVAKLAQDRDNDSRNEQEANQDEAENFPVEKILFKEPNRSEDILNSNDSPPDYSAEHKRSLSNRTNGKGYSHILLGSRANYSIPEVDEFVIKFKEKYSASKLAIDDGQYVDFLKRFQTFRVKGSKLPAYFGSEDAKPWEKFHSGIHQHFLYSPDDPAIEEMLEDYSQQDVISVEQYEGGTQMKLVMTFADDSVALFKPMRFGRNQETLPDHFYFADFERHHAEIAAFHLDRILGFNRVPPTIGRVMNVSQDIHSVADKKLLKTFFLSPAGNLCFHGSCSYYCDSSHPVCGHPVLLEGSLAAFLPPSQMASRKTWRNPWKRSYSKHRKAYWEVYSDLCDKVKEKPPYNEGRRLLDILDMSVFDFLTGNLDRHHYETFKDFGNDTFILHLDNGRAFGKAQYDCLSCLAPVTQCCMIRLSTLAKLVKLYLGPNSLSSILRASLTSDPLNPILLEPHLNAVDRRLSKLLQAVNECLVQGSNTWDEVVIDDGIL